jgi:hypothetical protein
MTQASPSSDQKIATSEKLDWLDAVIADHRLDARAKVIAYCIRQHVNRDTGIAFVSDATITDKTGVPNRWVRRARNDLRAANWIDWKRTRTANVYSTSTEPMAAIAEQQRTLKEARDTRRRERPRVAEHELGNSDRPQVAEHDGPQVAGLVRPRVADIPLSVNPLEEPLSKNISANGSSDLKAASRNHSGSKTAFEIFWQVFPRKAAKDQAEKIYAAVLKSGRATAADLLAGAERYAVERAVAEQAGDDPKYTRSPVKWMEGGCWMDEPGPPPKPTKQSFIESATVGFGGFLRGGSDE